MLIDQRTNVTAGTEIRDHVKIVESLERIVELNYKLVVNLPLDLFLCDHEPSEAVVCSFLHAFHRKEVVRVDLLHQVYLGVGATAKACNSFEVFRGDVEVLSLSSLGLLAILLDVKQHVGSLLHKVYHLDVAIVSCVVKRCLFHLIDAFGGLVTGSRKFLEQLGVAPDAGQVHRVLEVGVLDFDVDKVFYQEIQQAFVVVKDCIV